jgi:hypothetical protein
MRRSTRNAYGRQKTSAVCHCHDPRPLPPFASTVLPGTRYRRRADDYHHAGVEALKLIARTRTQNTKPRSSVCAQDRPARDGQRYSRLAIAGWVTYGRRFQRVLGGVLRTDRNSVSANVASWLSRCATTNETDDAPALPHCDVC